MAVVPKNTVQQHASDLMSEVLSETARLVVTLNGLDLVGGNADVVRSVYRGPDATIQSINAVITGTLATADAVVTATIDGSAVTGGVITIAQPGAAGDVVSVSPTAANVLVDGATLELTASGGQTASEFADLSVFLLYVPVGS